MCVALRVCVQQPAGHEVAAWWLTAVFSSSTMHRAAPAPGPRSVPGDRKLYVVDSLNDLHKLNLCPAGSQHLFRKCPLPQAQGSPGARPLGANLDVGGCTGSWAGLRDGLAPGMLSLTGQCLLTGGGFPGS